MKLADWRLQFYHLPYRREVVWSNAVEKVGVYALLKLVGDDGSTGLAEGTIEFDFATQALMLRAGGVAMLPAAIPPTGGLMLMAGWLCVGAAAVRGRRR